MNDTLRDGRRHSFYIVDNAVIDKYGPQIGVYGIAVYNLIARYADSNGENAFPSLTTITKKLDISRPKAVTTLNKLVEVGLIHREHRHREDGSKNSSLYTIIDLHPSKPDLPGSKLDLPPLVNDVDYPSKPGLPDQDTFKKTPTDVAAQPALIAPDTPTAAPEPPPRVKKPRVSGGKKEASPTTQEILAGYAELKGIEIDYGMEGVWAKKLGEAGATRETVAGCYKWLKEKPYYEEVPVTLATVYKNWPEYTHHLEKRKPTPKPSVITIYNQYTGQHEERRLS
jgi:hypothetical protein